MVNAPFCTKACRSIGDANRAEGPHTSHSGVCVSSRRDWGLTSTDTKTTVSPWDSGSSSRTGTQVPLSAKTARSLRRAIKFFLSPGGARQYPGASRDGRPGRRAGSPPRGFVCRQPFGCRRRSRWWLGRAWPRSASGHPRTPERWPERWRLGGRRRRSVSRSLGQPDHLGQPRLEPLSFTLSREPEGATSPDNAEVARSILASPTTLLVLLWVAPPWPSALRCAPTVSPRVGCGWTAASLGGPGWPVRCSVRRPPTRRRLPDSVTAANGGSWPGEPPGAQPLGHLRGPPALRRRRWLTQGRPRAVGHGAVPWRLGPRASGARRLRVSHAGRAQLGCQAPRKGCVA